MQKCTQIIKKCIQIYFIISNPQEKTELNRYQKDDDVLFIGT